MRMKIPEPWERNKAWSAFKTLLVNKSTAHLHQAFQFTSHHAILPVEKGHTAAYQPQQMPEPVSNSPSSDVWDVALLVPLFGEPSGPLRAVGGTWCAGACLEFALATKLNHNRAVGAGRFSGILPQPSLASKLATKLCWRAAVLEVLWWQQISIGAWVSACARACAEPCVCTRRRHVNKCVLFLQSNRSFLEMQISLHLRGSTGSATAKLHFEWDLNTPNNYPCCTSQTRVALPRHGC